MTVNAMRAGAAYVELQARADRLVADVQRAARQAGQAAGRTISRSISERMSSMGESMQRVGSTLTSNVSVPVAGVGAAVIKLGSDFQYQMERVRNISLATGSDFATMKQQAKDLGASTQYSATQAAEGMEFLAMAGFKPKEIFEAMPAVLNGAAAANMDLGDTANIVSNIMTGFGLKATEATRATDLLTKASQMGNVDVQGLGESFKYGGSMAKMAGMSVEETAAAFTLMGNAGIQGSMGGTAVGAALRSMMKPSKFAEAEMKKLGLTFQKSNGKLKPLPQIIDEVGKSGATNEQFLRIFGTEGGRAISALSEQGSDAMRKLTKEIEGSSGTTERFAANMSETSKAGMAGFTSALEGLAIAISESGVLEAFTKVLTKVTSLVRKLTETNPEVMKYGFAFLAVAAAVGPAAKVMGLLFGWVTKIGPAFRLVGQAASFSAGAVRTGAGAVSGAMRTAGTAAAGVARSAGTAAVNVASSTGRMAASAARASGQFAVQMGRMALSAATNVARIAVSFTVQAAAATGKFLTAVIRVAATSVAKFALMAARAIVWAATMAAQWLIAMGPIGWIIATVAALVVAIVANWDSIKKHTLRIWGAVTDWLKGIPGKILGWFKSWPIVGTVVKHWDSIKDGVKRKAGQMVDYVKGIPGRVKRALGDFGKLLYNKGKDLVRGLWNGIKAMGAWLRDTLVGWATDMIPGPIADALGIRSPSRLMRDTIGRYIPLGVVAGIEETTPAVERAMRDMVRVPDIPIERTADMRPSSALARSRAEAAKSDDRLLATLARLELALGADQGDVIVKVGEQELARAAARGQRQLSRR